jgi:ABC-2 type transport system ATP-binding protein
MVNFAIQTKSLLKTFKNKVAVNKINLEILPGEIFALLGPNGAGKTTTVKLISGLIQPTSGQITVYGNDVQKEPITVKRMIGILPDNPYIYPKLTGMEFMKITATIYSVPNNGRDAVITELFDKFDLTDAADQLIETYSRGMKQKLVLSSVLLHQPKLLLLDEPLVGLDPKSSRIVKDIFIELSKTGTTVFMCTHILEIAEKIANRIGIINNGELIAIDSQSELRKKLAASNLEDIYFQLTNPSGSPLTEQG